MKTAKNAILSISFFLLPALTYASTQSVNCSEVIGQLKQMKQAQLAVQGSLIANHEMMADSMESYSDALKSSGGKAHKTVAESMSTASESLRKRGEKGQSLAKQLAEQTDEIIQIAEKCLN